MSMDKIMKARENLRNNANKVLGLVRRLHPKAIMIGIDGSEDPPRVEIGVPVPDYKSTLEKLLKSNLYGKVDNEFGINLHMKHIPPKLIHARIGEFVIPYQDFLESEERMGTGIVTAKYVTNGKVRYGCKYLIPNISLRHSDPLSYYDQVIRLTADDYGGHPVGFYRVITPEEASMRVRAALERDIEKAMSHIKEGLGNVDKFIAFLQSNKTITKAEILAEKQ